MRFWSLSVNQMVWSSSGKARIWGGPPDCRLSELAIMFVSPYRVGELFIIKLNFSTQKRTIIVQQAGDEVFTLTKKNWEDQVSLEHPMTGWCHLVLPHRAGTSFYTFGWVRPRFTETLPIISTHPGY